MNTLAKITNLFRINKMKSKKRQTNQKNNNMNKTTGYDHTHPALMTVGMRR